MNVKTSILITLFLINLANSDDINGGYDIDTLIIREKIDRVGNIQNGGELDMGKALNKNIMDRFEADDFFASELARDPNRKPRTLSKGY